VEIQFLAKPSFAIQIYKQDRSDDPMRLQARLDNNERRRESEISLGLNIYE